MLIPVKNAGAIGVIKDVSQSELPINAWTDASNIRFISGSALQFYGHSEAYNTPTVAPQFVMPVSVGSARYWMYHSASKSFVVTNSGGTAVHTGVVNQWTGFVFGGIPVMNTGDTATVPMYWDMNLANKFVDLTAWPANTYCKSLRPYKNFLVALNVTKAGTNYPHMIKWSHPADPGTLPSTWDITDTTKDAGEQPIAEGDGEIVDGLQLKDSFIVYKERSAHRMDFIGGVFVMSNKQIFGMSGLLQRNCVVEFDGYHLAVTSSDVVVHDGYNAQSVLDNAARRFFFQNIDEEAKGRVFVFKNPFLNEIFIAYPSIGATVCDKALVYNYKDKTVTFRSLPNLNHATYGAVANDLVPSWAADADPWDADLTAWNGPDYTPGSARVLMASADTKLYLLDGSASFNGVIPSAHLERRCLPIGSPDRRILVRGIRPIIYGNEGATVIVKVGYADSPFAEPTYTSMTHTIGSTLKVDCMVNGRYIAIRFESGTAYQWRLDSYQIDAVDAGAY
jgi:hypothetical protein